MKFHSPADVKLLSEGVKVLKCVQALISAWRLGILHVENVRQKKMQDQKQ